MASWGSATAATAGWACFCTVRVRLFVACLFCVCSGLHSMHSCAFEIVLLTADGGILTPAARQNLTGLPASSNHHTACPPPIRPGSLLLNAACRIVIQCQLSMWHRPFFFGLSVFCGGLLACPWPPQGLFYFFSASFASVFVYIRQTGLTLWLIVAGAHAALLLIRNAAAALFADVCAVILHSAAFAGVHQTVVHVV